MLFFIILFIVLVGGGWLIGKAIGNALFPDNQNQNTYIDRSVHYHEHKHINIIDDATKKSIFELKNTIDKK